MFFKRDEFSQEEILFFIKEIEEKYKDEQLRKSVSTLINLKILQFQISQEEKPKTRNIAKKSKKLNLKTEEKDKFYPLISRLKDS